MRINILVTLLITFFTSSLLAKNTEEIINEHWKDFANKDDTRVLECDCKVPWCDENKDIKIRLRYAEKSFEGPGIIFNRIPYNINFINQLTILASGIGESNNLKIKVSNQVSTMFYIVEDLDEEKIYFCYDKKQWKF